MNLSIDHPINMKEFSKTVVTNSSKSRRVPNLNFSHVSPGNNSKGSRFESSLSRSGRASILDSMT